MRPCTICLPVCPIACYLRDRLDHAMAQADRRGSILAVVCLDLDNFKGINDRHGHTVGDELLTAVAHRMKSTMKHDDILARLGGDEFIAVLPTSTIPTSACRWSGSFSKLPPSLF